MSSCGPLQEKETETSASCEEALPTVLGLVSEERLKQVSKAYACVEPWCLLARELLPL
jgi:hypothetical protein